MKLKVEEVFVTEGIPQFTFVKPPNYNEILLDVRRKGKPVIVEGQSGTGKTTTVKKIINQLSGEINIRYYTARQPNDIWNIQSIVNEKEPGYYIIDDFHRLPVQIQTDLANLAKLSAETADEGLPKLILVGINQVGAALINMVPDIAKRCGIHRIAPADKETTLKLIERGEERLNIKISAGDQIYEESKGDYWLTQSLCQTSCIQNDILESQIETRSIEFKPPQVRKSMVTRLSHAYKDPVKEFCRGRRFRPSNDPYFKLLRLISGQESSIVDLNELANANDDMRASINGIKENRLHILVESKPICALYFFYNRETKIFAVEDPALFYYMHHVDWEEIRKECGFRENLRQREFEIAISFAGENRPLAKYIAEGLQALDFSVFFDEHYEANYLGKAWSKEFERIFLVDSKYVVCLLDVHHRHKIWPTFERDCFKKRVPDGEVIPIFLDDTVFAGIPDDIVGIKYKWNPSDSKWQERVDDEIIYKIWEKLESE
jgi:hypothetical protein